MKKWCHKLIINSTFNIKLKPLHICFQFRKCSKHIFSNISLAISFTGFIKCQSILFTCRISNLPKISYFKDTPICNKHMLMTLHFSNETPPDASLRPFFHLFLLFSCILVIYFYFLKTYHFLLTVLQSIFWYFIFVFFSGTFSIYLYMYVYHCFDHILSCFFNGNNISGFLLPMSFCIATRYFSFVRLLIWKRRFI